jgi:ABC-type multidrug transport system fused ATPase/permease subunit
LTDTPPAVADPASPLPPPTDYSIEFRDVRFRYAPGGPVVLDQVTFRLPTGGHLAVLGQSGAGKTSLVNLLLRFWEAEEGCVCIGGRDVRAYRADDLRRLIGVVPQEIYLFNGTIRDNLLLANGSATDNEIVAACREAQLDDLIASLPHGLDTRVGDNGLKLSGGERQRLAIARVFLKGAPVLVLDEATANLDGATELKVMQALATFMQGRTTLIISHRRAALEPADHMIVLERGRVARGLGTPHQAA